MTKQEKIDSLEDVMTMSKKHVSLVNFYHFSDKASKELEEIFQKHTDHSLNDLDFEIFSSACDIVSEIYNNNPTATKGQIEDAIYVRSNDSASIFTINLLSYLNIYNEEDISEIVREGNGLAISTACALWYDRQVEQAAILIKDWINA